MFVLVKMRENKYEITTFMEQVVASLLIKPLLVCLLERVIPK